MRVEVACDQDVEKKNIKVCREGWGEKKVGSGIRDTATITKALQARTRTHTAMKHTMHVDLLHVLPASPLSVPN